MKSPACYRFLFVALFATVSVGGFAQGLQLQWVKGVTGSDDVDPGPIAVDNQKALYIGGSFKGTADFDPGTGTASLNTSTGFANAGSFLAKYDAQGSYVFAYKLADNGNLAISDMVLDNSGNICITGIFDSTVDFDPSPATANMTSIGSLDIFVARYTAGGAYINAFRIGGSSTDVPDAIASDASGNLYVTGSFKTTTDFDPGPGTSNLVSAGDGDIFLAKYSGSGVLNYAFRMGGTSLDQGHAVEVDAAGNAYLGGNFVTSIDLDPGSSVATVAYPGINGFFAKYGPTGNYLTGFAYDLGTVNEVALDATGNVYILGRFQDSIDADPSPAIAKFYSVNGNDIYLTKLDASGSFLRATAFRSNDAYAVSGMATNHQSSIYVYGWSQDTVYFDPISTTHMLTSNGDEDGFVTKFDASGNFAHGASFGSTLSDIIRSLAQDGQGDVWLAGYFNGTVDFDPSVATANLSSMPKAGMFFGRYTDPMASSVRPSPSGPLRVKIYSAGNAVIIDFSTSDMVNAHVRVTNLLGQTIAMVRHTRADMLRLALPDAVAGIYVVTVSNGSATMTQKVWVR